MTVKELIIELLEYDMDKDVVVDLGDNCLGNVLELEPCLDIPIIHFDNWKEEKENDESK